MTTAIQLLVSGLAMGAIYGVIAASFVLIHRVSKIVHLGIPEVIMLAAIISVHVPRATGLARLVVVAAILVGAGLLAWASDSILIEPAVQRRAGPALLLVVTLGMAITLRGVALIFFGRDTYSAPRIIDLPPLSIYGAAIELQTIALGVSGILVGIVLTISFRKTMIGKALTATASNLIGARLVGISPRAMRRSATIVAFILAAYAGMALISIIPFEYTSVAVGYWGLVAAAMAGFDSADRAILFGLLLGALQMMVARYVSSQYEVEILYSILIVIILAYPKLLDTAELIKA